MDGKSLDIRLQQIEKLRSLFPESVSEGKIDFEKLKLTLGEDLAIPDERYVFNWAGKAEAFHAIQIPSTATLKPRKEESVDFDSAGHVFIEGENLEALKVLQKSYFNKIKMIYIDPPYNTGNDSFIYPDNFSESKEEYLKRAGEMDEEGYLTREGLFHKNSKDSGRYHSNWLSMMYPRLFLARNLLREDGVIFVSIDDNEVHNLRLIMNEIFGEENLIDTIIWKKRYGGGAKEKYLVTLHEYALMYARNKEALDPIFIPSDPEDIERYYKFKDENYEKRGGYRTHPLEATKSMDTRVNLVYPIPGPEGDILPRRQWLWSKERALRALAKRELEFVKGKEGWNVHTKQYWKDESGQVRQSKAFSIIEDVYTQHGTNEILEIFGNAKIFSFPKPTGFIKPLIQLGSSPDTGEIIMDFFAGSAATGHAVLELNKEDGGNRKLILVQLPEKTEEDSEAYKAGYKTIAEIAKERIRRVIKKLPELKPNGKTKNGDKDQLPMEMASPAAVAIQPPPGVKVFRLESSNFKIWRTEEMEELARLDAQMNAFIDPVKPGSYEENMAWEILLKSGYDLTTPIEPFKIGKISLYKIADGETIAAVESIDEEAILQIVRLKPKQFICLDKLFQDDEAKSNAFLKMRDAGIEFQSI